MLTAGFAGRAYIGEGCFMLRSKIRKKSTMNLAISATVRKITNASMDFVCAVIRAWMSRFAVPFWLQRLKPPPPAHTRARTPAQEAVETFLASKPLGATIFWTPPGAGKSTALAANTVMTVDFKLLRNTGVGAWFAGKVGWDKELGEFFPPDGFATIALDHFDRAIDADKSDAKRLFTSLTADSARSRSFNVLVCVNDPATALDLFRDSADVRLLGPPFCGRCTAEHVSALFPTHQLAIELGAIAGTVGLAADAAAPRVTADLLRLRAAKTARAWVDGESLLASCRSTHSACTL